MDRFWSKFGNGNFKIFDLSHTNGQKSTLIVSNWSGMLNNIYLSTLYKNILPNPDFRAHFGTKISVPKFSFRNVLFVQLSPQIHHKIILNSYLMRLSIVLWFVMVSEQFEQIFQNMLFLKPFRLLGPGFSQVFICFRSNFKTRGYSWLKFGREWGNGKLKSSLQNFPSLSNFWGSHGHFWIRNLIFSEIHISDPQKSRKSKKLFGNHRK